MSDLAVEIPEPTPTGDLTEADLASRFVANGGQGDAEHARETEAAEWLQGNPQPPTDVAPLPYDVNDPASVDAWAQARAEQAFSDRIEQAQQQQAAIQAWEEARQAYLDEGG